MYIWRGKNRRDKRDFLTSNEHTWIAPKELKNHEVDDELLRQQHENDHVNYFSQKVDNLIKEYIETESGQTELQFIVTELEKYSERLFDYLLKDDVNQERYNNIRANVFKIYKDYSINMSEQISLEGLDNLLTYLRIDMNQNEFDRFVIKLQPLEDEPILFENFFQSLINDRKQQQKKKNSFINRLLSSISNKEQNNTDYLETMSAKVEKRLREIEATNLIIEYTVFHSEHEALKEFRIAHPPKHPCLLCDQIFLNANDLSHHMEDSTTYHKKQLEINIERQNRFRFIDNVFAGEHGRQVKAHRLIFSKELGTQEIRILAAKPDPFRPYLADPSAKWEKQLLKGMFVQGKDAKSGIRPIPRRFGLKTQHFAPIRNAGSTANIFRPEPLPQLQDVVNDLLRCQDNYIDVVSTFDPADDVDESEAAGDPHGITYRVIASRALKPKTTFPDDISYLVIQRNTIQSHQTIVDQYQDSKYLNQTQSFQDSHDIFVQVRFEWNQFAADDVYLIGEFNGWKPERMDSNYLNGTFFLIKKLCPGRYRYRFQIKNKDYLNEIASQIKDILLATLEYPYDRMVTSNILLVTNTKVIHETSKTVTSPTSRMSQVPKGSIIHISQTDQNALVRRLHTINLRNLSLFDDGAWVLASNIKRNSMIVVLDLSYNGISDDGMQAIGHAIKCLLALEDMKLNGNGFGVDGCRYLTTGLKDNQTLTNLELSSNRIGDDGMEMICKYLKYNRSLMNLYVDSCLIGDDGMEALTDCLLCNKVLQKLSLSNNKMKVEGTKHLRNTLLRNASLTELNLSYCPFGALGSRHIADILVKNDTLSVLDMSYVDLIGGRNTSAIFSFCHGLHHNTHLKTLKLCGNDLEDDHVIDLAEALTRNKSLIELDLHGNRISQVWFQDKMMIPTFVIPLMPSIETSLQVNRISSEFHQQNYQKTHDRQIDYSPIGMWTRRRTWNKINDNRSKIEEARKDEIEETTRIQQESEFISRELNIYAASMKRYLGEDPCQNFIKSVAHDITQYLYDLVSCYDPTMQNNHGLNQVKFDDSSSSFSGNTLFNDEMKQDSIDTVSINKMYSKKLPIATPPTESVALRRKSIELSQISSPSSKSLGSLFTGPNSRVKSPLYEVAIKPFSPGISKSSKVSKSISKKIVVAPSPPTVSIKTVTVNSTQNPKKMSKSNEISKEVQSTADKEIEKNPIVRNNNKVFTSETIEPFMNIHVSVLMAIFMQLSAGSRSMLLHPEQLEYAMKLLALPITGDELQKAIDLMILPSPVLHIPIHSFSDYILSNAQRISRINRWQRYRILLDLTLHPPVQEAKSIILDQLIYNASVDLRDQYRSIAANKPKYLCRYCQARFATLKMYKRHRRKGIHSTYHRMFRMKEMIHRSQLLFLQQVKWKINHVFFPAYYELLHVDKLPKNYFPQIVDKIGSEGRPIGVIEDNRTVRVLDAFGEYLFISFQGRFGWVRYRKGKHYYLQPACTDGVGFDWETLRIQEVHSYYRVSDYLPSDVELKVRYQPLLSGAVCGHIHRGDVVECFAVIGDWLQIRYKTEDSAWILWRNPAITSKNSENPSSGLNKSSHSDNVLKEFNEQSLLLKDIKYIKKVIGNYKVNESKFNAEIVKEFKKIRGVDVLDNPLGVDRYLILLPDKLQQFIIEFNHHDQLVGQFSINSMKQVMQMMLSGRSSAAHKGHHHHQQSPMVLTEAEILHIIMTDDYFDKSSFYYNEYNSLMSSSPERSDGKMDQGADSPTEYQESMEEDDMTSWLMDSPLFHSSSISDTIMKPKRFDRKKKMEGKKKDGKRFKLASDLERSTHSDEGNRQLDSSMYHTTTFDSMEARKDLLVNQNWFHDISLRADDFNVTNQMDGGPYETVADKVALKYVMEEKGEVGEKGWMAPPSVSMDHIDKYYDYKFGITTSSKM